MKYRFVFAVLMSGVLTFFMSAWVTFINVGLKDDFISYWMAAWLLAWPVAGLVSFVCGPKVQRWAGEIAGRF